MTTPVDQLIASMTPDQAAELVRAEVAALRGALATTWDQAQALAAVDRIERVALAALAHAAPPLIHQPASIWEPLCKNH